MSPFLILCIIAAYFAAILGVSALTSSKKGSSSDFFRGGGKSPWYIVAISTIGSSISGVTFLSVPGMVAASEFSYMQMVIGFTFGYVAVAYVLLPLYYRINMNSIYGYLEQRYGRAGYFTGAAFFLISKLLGCGVRMFLTASVLQLILFDSLGIPFWLNVAVTMVIVWLYTFRGGVRTLVWADMLQTFAMIIAVVLCIVYVSKAMGLDFSGLCHSIGDSGMARTWFFDDLKDTRYFWKQFLAGMFTTITMTGLDQDMMQKNLSCKNLKDAQKNMVSSGFLYLPINLIFLCLGVLLFQYCASAGIAVSVGPHAVSGGIKPDQVFATVATGGAMPLAVGILFVLGLVAAAFSSAGSAVTALTTSFTVDFLRADRRLQGLEGEELAAAEKNLVRTRLTVHAVTAIVMGFVIYAFRIIGNQSVINAVYMVASYTYGPLLGIYAFGMATKLQPRKWAVPLICILSPLICLVLHFNSEAWFGGYRFGFEMLLINGAITFLGLLLASFQRNSYLCKE